MAKANSVMFRVIFKTTRRVGKKRRRREWAIWKKGRFIGLDDIDKLRNETNLNIDAEDIGRRLQTMRQNYHIDFTEKEARNLPENLFRERSLVSVGVPKYSLNPYVWTEWQYSDRLGLWILRHKPMQDMILSDWAEDDYDLIWEPPLKETKGT